MRNQVLDIVHWHYNKAIELKPDNAEAYNNRGIAYENIGEHAKAIFDYSEAIKLNSAFKEAYLNRAFAYRLIGEIEKAKADEESWQIYD